MDGSGWLPTRPRQHFLFFHVFRIGVRRSLAVPSGRQGHDEPLPKAVKGLSLSPGYLSGTQGALVVELGVSRDTASPSPGGGLPLLYGVIQLRETLSMASSLIVSP